MRPSAAGPRNAIWDDDPQAYDALRECWLNQRRREFLTARLGDAPMGDSVLEIGSGTGRLCIELARDRPDLRFVGVEPLRGYVEFSQWRATQQRVRNVQFLQGVAERLDDVLDAQMFDWILSNDVLHHVEDMAAAVHAVAQHARPSGRWIAIEPNPLNPYVLAMHALRTDEHIFRARAFLASASAAGWALVGRRSLFVVPPQITSPPAWMKKAERRLEGVWPIAGGLVIDLRRR